MTDRVCALTVVLENDIREDDAEAIITAIGQLRGVLKVDGHVSDIALHVAESRVRHELIEKVYGVLSPV